MNLLDIGKFFLQFFLILSSASALWCFVFSFKSKRSRDSIKKQAWSELSSRLSNVLFASSIIFAACWWLFFLLIYPTSSLAHEGVTNAATLSEIFLQNGFSANMPFVALLTFFSLMMVFLRFKKPQRFKKYSEVFFATQFILLSIILSFSIFNGNFDLKQLTLSLHSWHSILTLGTVVVVDILYLISLKKDYLKRVLYPFLPVMSFVIWTGLGLDFLSSMLGSDYMQLPNTQQFLFNQILIVIVIINGTFLSVRVNDMFINLIKPQKVLALSRPVNKLIGVLGSVSIVTWLSVTFLDFITTDLSIIYLFLIYSALIAVAYFTKTYVERLFLQIR